MTIQVNLVPNPRVKFGGGNASSPVIKIFAINLPSQPFLGCHLGFHRFFHSGLFGDRTLFYSLAVLV